MPSEAIITARADRPAFDPLSWIRWRMGRARALAFAGLSLLLLVSPVGRTLAQEAPAQGEPGVFRQVIEAQIQAFALDDGEAAFSHASPTIQGIFGTPGNFMNMVRNGYQPVYRPRAYDFEAPRQTENGWQQPMIVIGPDGVTYRAIYDMQRQEDGVWKINGCRLERIPEQSV